MKTQILDSDNDGIFSVFLDCCLILELYYKIDVAFVDFNCKQRQ